MSGVQLVKHDIVQVEVVLDKSQLAKNRMDQY